MNQPPFCCNSKSSFQVEALRNKDKSIDRIRSLTPILKQEEQVFCFTANNETSPATPIQTSFNPPPFQPTHHNGNSNFKIALKTTLLNHISQLLIYQIRHLFQNPRNFKPNISYTTKQKIEKEKNKNVVQKEKLLSINVRQGHIIYCLEWLVGW